MCGRYTLTQPDELVEELGAEALDALEPRYNIAPTQQVPVVRPRRDTGARIVMNLRWGLIPSWAKDMAIGNRMINARSETASSKPAFRAAFRRRRCGVLADGFYEWRKAKGGKQPYHIHRTDRRPFLMAGLWERWNGPDGKVDSFSILTTAANDTIRPLHDRMPVILPPESWARWLDHTIEEVEPLEALLMPYDPQAVAFHAVDRRVGRPQFEDASAVEPIATSLFD